MKAIADHVEWMIKMSYNWFARSTIKQNEYKVTLELVGFAQISEILSQETDANDDNTMTSTKKKALKFLSPSLTRWLVIADCLQRILQQVSLEKLCCRYKPLVCIYQI